MSAEPGYRPVVLAGQSSPVRKLDWRFTIAAALATNTYSERHPLVQNAVRDPYVRTFARFLRLLDRTADERQILVCEPKYPGPLHAYQLHVSAAEVLSHHIQARILARQTDEEIADAIGASVDAVAWYERMFFHVRDRINARDWIVRSILLTEPPFSLSATPYVDATTLKLYSYFAGAEAANVLISGVNPATGEWNTANCTSNIRDHYGHAVAQKGLSATRAYRVTQQTAGHILEICSRTADAVRLAKNNEGSSSASISLVLERHVEDILQQLAPAATDRDYSANPARQGPAHVLLRDSEISAGLTLTDVPPAIIRKEADLVLEPVKREASA